MMHACLYSCIIELRVVVVAVLLGWTSPPPLVDCYLVSARVSPAASQEECAPVSTGVLWVVLTQLLFRFPEFPCANTAREFVNS